MPVTVSLQEVLEIPGNADVYERLKKIVSERAAIAFVGAGASAPIYPLWQELIARLADEPLRRGLATKADKDYWLSAAKTKPLQVVAQIHNKLGDSLYFSLLYEIFRDRVGNDGKSYTAAHAAIVRAPFKACITTNYDPGLLEARRELHGGSDTGFTLWDQTHQIQQWSSGEALISQSALPILYAHGHFAAPSSIVLDHPSYHRAYHSTPYRRLFENLWIQQRLVFTGFGFSDVTLTQIADDVLWQTSRPAGAEPRHLALIGLEPDQLYSPEMRHEYLSLYSAEVLFYPVRRITGKPDHSALVTILESLETKSADTLDIGYRMKVFESENRFIHETTDDDFFTGRADFFSRLDRWATDLNVRIIGISGIGGLGKTAAVSAWMRSNHHGRKLGLFWSFYRERNLSTFFDTMLANYERPSPTRISEKISATLTCLQTQPTLLVLDGLEVMQEEAGSPSYGKLLNVELAEFLHRHCNSRTESLIILTSRFPFPDLTSQLGRGLRAFALRDLDAREGATLLERLGIDGSVPERQAVSERLSGHPLALRLFARSMPSDLGNDPSRLWRLVFDTPTLAYGDNLEAKMARLLSFYEESLPLEYRDILSLLALFRVPVGEAALRPLWTQLLNHADVKDITPVLESLRRERLLSTDIRSGEVIYSAHPILNDHFRLRLLGQRQLARTAAGLLARQPREAIIASVEGARIIANAIEFLLDAGEIIPANDLFQVRLQNGRATRNIPAPDIGMEVAQAFVRDKQRRREVERVLGDGRIAFFFHEIGVNGGLAGEPEVALEFLHQAIELHKKAQRTLYIAATLRAVGQIEVALGLLDQGMQRFSEAADLATSSGTVHAHTRGARNAHCHRAAVESLRGNLSGAESSFTAGGITAAARDGKRENLQSMRGLLWAEHLLRIRDVEPVRQLAIQNIERCTTLGWRDHVAHWQYILGHALYLSQQHETALSHLEQALSDFITGHMIYEISATLNTTALCHLSLGDFDAASAAVDRTLALAAPRNYRLLHAEGLVARATILLSRGSQNLVVARDDCEAALHISEYCDYAWGRLAALECLSHICIVMGADAEAHRFAQDASILRQQLFEHGAAN